MTPTKHDLNPRGNSLADTIIGRVLLFILLLGVSSFLAGRAFAQPSDVIETFPVGGGPNALAFDGSNVWVTNLYDGTVSKLPASDGALLGTCPSGGGRSGLA